MFKSRYQLYGMTLVELMLAIALALFIVSALTSVYVIASKNQEHQLALNNILENERTALAILHYQIQYAGLLGCVKNYPDLNISPGLSYPVTGTHNSITIFRTNPVSAVLQRPMEDQNQVRISMSPRFKKNAILLISDCDHAEIIRVQIASVYNGMQKITPLSPFRHRYSSTAEVSNFYQNTFYVKNTGKKTRYGEPVSGLYVETIKHRHNALLEGVDEMEIRYDVLAEGSVVTKTAEQVSDWSLVKGVSIRLRLSSVLGTPLKKTVYTHIALREV